MGHFRGHTQMMTGYPNIDGSFPIENSNNWRTCGFSSTPPTGRASTSRCASEWRAQTSDSPLGCSSTSATPATRRPMRGRCPGWAAPPAARFRSRRSSTPRPPSRTSLGRPPAAPARPLPTRPRAEPGCARACSTRCWAITTFWPSSFRSTNDAWWPALLAAARSGNAPPLSVLLPGFKERLSKPDTTTDAAAPSRAACPTRPHHVRTLGYPCR
jgi:hypothetical protein